MPQPQLRSPATVQQQSQPESRHSRATVCHIPATLPVCHISIHSSTALQPHHSHSSATAPVPSYNPTAPAQSATNLASPTAPVQHNPATSHSNHSLTTLSTYNPQKPTAQKPTTVTSPQPLCAVTSRVTQLLPGLTLTFIAPQVAMTPLL